MKRTVRRVGLLLFVANIFLAIIKFGVWIYTDSLAIKAEAINSVVDSMYSGVIFLGIITATKDPNDRYPEGYKRLEPFVSLFIAVGIMFTATVLVYQSINASTASYNITNTPAAIIVIGITIAVKIALYKICISKSNETDSPALYAAGVDNRNDIMSVFIALFGVFGAIIQFQVLDVIAAILIALIIGYSGVEIARENIAYILGQAPSEQERNAIKKAALSHPDVHGIHDFCSHYSGPNLDISLHVEVKGGKTIEEGHVIEIEVADRIRDVSERTIDEINIHVDPDTLDEWKTADD